MSHSPEILHFLDQSLEGQLDRLLESITSIKKKYLTFSCSLPSPEASRSSMPTPLLSYFGIQSSPLPSNLNSKYGISVTALCLKIAVTEDIAFVHTNSTVKIANGRT